MTLDAVEDDWSAIGLAGLTVLVAAAATMLLADPAPVPAADPSLAEVAAAPSVYAGQRVQVSGHVGRTAVDEYYLASGGRLPVQPWAPYTVAQCPPARQECEPPPSMMDFLDQNVTVRGTVAEVGGRYQLVNVTVLER